MTKKIIDTEAEARRKQKNELDAAFETLGCLIGNYLNFVLTPQLMAVRRRQAGDPSTSPQDYDCCCGVTDEVGIPVCRSVRPGCKFAGCKTSVTVDGGGGAMWWRMRSRERRRIQAESFAALFDEDRFGDEVVMMARALDRANERRRRAFGKPFSLAVTAFFA